MKRILKLLPLLALTIMVTSCNSVRVASDYDRNVDFNNYKTFAFYKPGVDNAEISDLDKRRILRAIESELTSKGFSKSENPDVLVSFFTNSEKRVDVYNNTWGWGAWGWGGWGPWGWGWNTMPSVSTTTEGSLYIDLIDANKKELVWQGQGIGYLTKSIDKKEERIRVFVNQILEQFPPVKN